MDGDHSYDLALLDVMVPGMNGFELLEVMNKYKIPVIFLTAKDDVSSKIQGLKGGAEDYIVKPFDPKELVARIQVPDSRLNHKKVNGVTVVQAMSKGDMIYFYNITGNGELILLSEQVNSYPKYRYDNGAMHQESPIHYLDISVTEDYVYALYSGRNYKDKAFQGNLLRVFDWNGKLVKEFHLDIDVQAITTTKNNQRIYAVSYLPDPVLVAFEQ